MKSLALETSATPGAVALLDQGEIVYETALPEQRRTTETFATCIQTALRQLHWSPREIELLAVCRGPGSFTGLRIGVTAAKAFCYATGCALVAVDTLELLAWQVPPTVPRLWSVVDAQRQEWFAACFAREVDGADGVGLRRLTPTQIVNARQFCATLSGPDALTGSGLHRVAAALPADVASVPASLWTARAGALGQLACRRFLGGQRDDPWQLSPDYYRPSAAEEKSPRG